MDSFDLVRIREVWKRLFNIDLEKKRHGLSSVAEHLRQLEKRHSETPLADRLLAEIDDENRLLVEIEAEEPAKGNVKKWRRSPSKPESKVPGVIPGDVFRIFGTDARTILTEEIPEADRLAILEEAARWFFDGGLFYGDGQWRRANVATAIQKQNLRRS